MGFTLNKLQMERQIKYLEKNVGSGEAADVEYDPTASHLEATNVQDAIDELSGEISGLSADDVSYDGTDSGLSSTTVQGAIDELDNKIDTLDASDVSYDNTYSGLTATDIQGAIDNYYTINNVVASVTADGVKSLSVLLDELYAQMSNVTGNRFVFDSAGLYMTNRIGFKNNFHAMYLGNNNNLELYYARLNASGSQSGHETITITTHVVSGLDNSSNVPDQGKVYRIIRA